jgi:hypothetical protein
VRSDDGTALVENDVALSWRAGRGSRNDAFPTGVAKVPFALRERTTACSMELLGGFVGVAQDPATFAVRPAMGWAVRRVAPTPGEVGPDGRPLHHVVLLAPRSAVVDAVLDEVRREVAPDASTPWFDLPSGGRTLRVHRASPPGVFPSAVVIVLVEGNADWTTDAATHEELERALLVSGRFADAPIIALWAPGDDPDGSSRDLLQRAPALVRELMHRDRTFVLSFDTAQLRASLEALGDRLT